MAIVERAGIEKCKGSLRLKRCKGIHQGLVAFPREMLSFYTSQPSSLIAFQTALSLLLYKVRLLGMIQLGIPRSI